MVSLICFIVVAIIVLNQNSEWDNRALDRIISEHRNSFLNGAMPIITYAGDLIFWVIIIAYLFLFGNRKKKKIGLILLIGLCISFLLVYGLKEGFARDRPALSEDKILVDSFYSDYSFPSGHTARGFFGFIIIFANFKKRYSFPILGLVTLVAYSRVYVGLHYPTDIIGGIFLGICLAAVLLIFSEKFEIIFKHLIQKKKEMK